MPEYDPPNAFYTQVTLPKHIKPEVFIGKEGCHLKRMTELSNCEYLWYDFYRGVIEVWGKERRLPKAVKMLKKRIESFDKPHVLKKRTEYRDDLIEVESWEEYPRNVMYTIIGPESNAIKYYLDKILQHYPSNPYFTCIQSKETLGNGNVKIIVKRSSSCD